MTPLEKELLAALRAMVRTSRQITNGRCSDAKMRAEDVAFELIATIENHAVSEKRKRKLPRKGNQKNTRPTLL